MQSNCMNEGTESQRGALWPQAHRNLATASGVRFWAPHSALCSLHPYLHGCSEKDLPGTDLSLSCCVGIFPVGPLCLETSGPSLQVSQKGPGFLTPAALDGEAKETQLASVAGLALDS